MAINGPLSVSFDEVFPHGAYALSVEKQRDFDKSTRENFVPPTTEDGIPWWVATIVDGDTTARQTSVKVKIAAAQQPVLPESVPGAPFAPVELEGLKVRAYVERESKRLAYSFTATGLRSPQPGAARTAANGSTSASSSASSSSSAGSSSGSGKDASASSKDSA